MRHTISWHRPHQKLHYCLIGDVVVVEDSLFIVFFLFVFFLVFADLKSLFGFVGAFHGLPGSRLYLISTYLSWHRCIRNYISSR